MKHGHRLGPPPLVMELSAGLMQREAPVESARAGKWAFAGMVSMRVGAVGGGGGVVWDRLGYGAGFSKMHRRESGEVQGCLISGRHFLPYSSPRYDSTASTTKINLPPLLSFFTEHSRLSAFNFTHLI